jgi:hypothetical protein
MTHTKERIEMIQLLQKLKVGDEKPGWTILRALRAAAIEQDRKCSICGEKAPDQE